jgi:hypothetical protein
MVTVFTPSVAVMLTFRVLDTGLVGIANEAEISPPGTIRVVGTVATPVLLDFSLMTTPVAGAGLLSVMVPVAESRPPTTDAGSMSIVKVTPRTLSNRAIEVGPRPAVIVTDLSTAMVWPSMSNWVVLAPAGTITVDGTVATVVSLDFRLTTTPPAGAGALIVTTP